MYGLCNFMVPSNKVKKINQWTAVYLIDSNAHQNHF